MNLKNLKMGTQLMIGFIIMLLFVLILGFVSYLQTQRLYDQIKTIFDHPLQVRGAIGEIQSSTYLIHWALESALSTDDRENIRIFIDLINEHELKVTENIDTIYNRYLGPMENVILLESLLNECYEERQLILNLLEEGNTSEAVSAYTEYDTSINSIHFLEIRTAINTISDFAKGKAEQLFDNSAQLKKDLNTGLITLILFLVFLSIVLVFILDRSIQSPLKELTDAVIRYKAGDPETRVDFESKNEFGLLASSFNSMIDSIETSKELKEKASRLSNVMLGTDDAQEFFRNTLLTLCEHTSSQTAAVYLIDDEEKYFDLFFSFGTEGTLKERFSYTELEGELGLAALTGEVQIINSIPSGISLSYNTAVCSFVPVGIMTIPVTSNNRFIAFISMAGIKGFSDNALEYVHSIHDTLCTRIQSILAYRTIRRIRDVLEEQNDELRAQKTELTAQASELMQQNMELETQKIQLDEANRHKDSFLSNVSHELRTPLNSIIALSGVLSRRLSGLVKDEEYSYIEVIERNGKNLLSLINDILDISRIEAGKEEVNITSFNVSTLISEIVSVIKPQADEKNIDLRFPDSSGIIEISSDYDKCTHILQNLIGNAVKFTDKGFVEIDLKTENNQVSITVKDSGIGIKKEHIPHIFDEFRQADQSTSRRYGGTGLGLTIAKKYASLLGGVISLKSTLNEGSEFTLVLPRSSENISQTEGIDLSGFGLKDLSRVRNRSHDHSVKTIMIVEDNESAVIQIKDLLNETGHLILTATGAKEAFDLLDTTIPDAIILDLMMPEIDGFEFLKTIRENERFLSIPVLILTAKQINKEELSFFKTNNVHNLIRKGNVNKKALLESISAMIYPKSACSGKRMIHKPKVLVAEDNTDNMLVIKTLLEDMCDIIEAESGESCVELAGEHTPDLILMDISLPGMSGIEAFSMIRKTPKLSHIPVIALTASIMFDERDTVLSHGFDAFLSKPVNKEELRV